VELLQQSQTLVLTCDNATRLLLTGDGDGDGDGDGNGDATPCVICFHVLPPAAPALVKLDCDKQMM
jgi:hypothetical protein